MPMAWKREFRKKRLSTRTATLCPEKSSAVSAAEHGNGSNLAIASGLLVTGFHWLSVPRSTPSVAARFYEEGLPKNKHELAAILIRRELSKGDKEAMEMLRIFEKYHIGRKTIQETKAELGIQSYRKMWKWYWHMEICEESEGGISKCRAVSLKDG